MGLEKGCPCCNLYKEDLEFKKVIELERAGLVIYRHTTPVNSVASVSQLEKALNRKNDVFIIHNTRNMNVSTSNYMSEFEQAISCPRCKYIVKHTKELLLNVPFIKKKDVIGICDHCRFLKRFNERCNKCQVIVEEFLKKQQRRQTETRDSDEQDKEMLSKIKNILKDAPKALFVKSKTQTHSEKSLKKQSLSYERYHVPSVKDMFDIQKKTERKHKLQKKEFFGHIELEKLYINKSDSEITFIEAKKRQEHNEPRKKILFNSTEDIAKPESLNESLESADFFGLDKKHQHRRRQKLKPTIEVDPTFKRVPSKELEEYLLKEKYISSPAEYETKKWPSEESDIYEKEKNKYRKKYQHSYDDLHHLKYDQEISKPSQKKEDIYVRGIQKQSRSDHNIQRYLSEKSLLRPTSEKTEHKLEKDFSYFFIKEEDDVKKKPRKRVSSSELIKDTQDMYRARAEEERIKKEQELKEKLEAEENKRLAKIERQKWLEQQRRLEELKKKKAEEDKIKSKKIEEQDLHKKTPSKQDTESQDKSVKTSRETSGKSKSIKLKTEIKESKIDSLKSERYSLKSKKDLDKSLKSERDSLKSKKDLDKQEKEESLRLEKERKLKEKLDKEEQMRLAKEEKQREKEEKEKEKANKGEQMRKAKEEKQREKEEKEKDKANKEEQIRLAKEEKQRETEEKEKEKANKREQIRKAKEEKQREKEIEKEKANKEEQIPEAKDEKQREKEEKEKDKANKEEQMRKAKEEKQREKEEKQKEKEKEKANKEEQMRKAKEEKQREKDEKEKQEAQLRNDVEQKQREKEQKLKEKEERQKEKEEKIRQEKEENEKNAKEKEEKLKNQQMEQQLMTDAQKDKELKLKKKQDDEAKKKEAEQKLKSLKEAKEEEPKKPQSKKIAEESKMKDLNINQVKIRRGSSDDLILRLVRIKQRQAALKDRPTRMSQLNISKKTLHAHKEHKNAKSHRCMLCLDSDLELDIENIRLKETKPKEKKEIIIGQQIFIDKPSLVTKKEDKEISPLLFSSRHGDENIIKPQETAKTENILQEKEKKPHTHTKNVEQEVPKGIIRYALSDRTFIEKGWTMLPTEKVVRKMNVYRMRPAHPEFDWFEHNKNKKLICYDTGEKLAEFDDNGKGRWFYRSGRVALDYYDAEEINAQQRIVIYNSGEPDDRGCSRPFAILATFDYLGNGIVFDHAGKIRLKYNQTEGVVLDRAIGPVSHWKWHTLNDPPVLQQVMIDTQMAHKDPEILKLGGAQDNKPRPDNEEMLAIEFDNFIKEKSKKLSQKFKPFQIKMKALKINEYFSLKVLDQATVYLIYRDGATNLKLNIGMILDHQEIVDTDTAEVGEVSNSLERFPARTDSLAALQRSVAHAQGAERARAERWQRLRPAQPVASADRLLAPLARPRPAPPPPATCPCRRPPAPNLYYNTRLI